MATAAVSAAPRTPAVSGAGHAPGAIARQALRDSRVRNLSFAVLFLAVAYIQPVAYGHTYPTQLERLGFARAFGDDKAVRLFYGVPHDLLTVGGYTAWRVGGMLSIFAAMWGVLAAVRALRTEEEAGRTELVLAGVVGRGAAFAAAVAAIAAGIALLYVATVLGLLLGGLPLGGGAFLALAVLSVTPVFAGAGAVASQLAPTRRLAIELGSATVVVALLLRVVADTTSLDWVRWATPLGWVEEMQAFAGARPLVLVLPLVASAALFAAAARIARRRDVGAGLLPVRDSAPPRLRLLSSPTAQALRAERGSLAAWLIGAGLFALVLGVVSHAITTAGLSPSLQREFARVGGGSIATPSGYLGFTFLFFILAVSLFCCSQVTAARRDESDGLLDTLLALPVRRRGWLAGRLLLATASAVVLALATGLLAWAGAASAGADVSFWRLLEAGANCLPVSLLFLGLGALAFAVVPRAASGIAYGLVSVAFLWQLFGALLGAPQWLLDLSPFEHVGLVPAQSFRAGSALVMLAIAAAAAMAAVWAFARRDLQGP